jgi:hypothetical protein
MQAGCEVDTIRGGFEQRQVVDWEIKMREPLENRDQREGPSPQTDQFKVRLQGGGEGHSSAPRLFIELPCLNFVHIFEVFRLRSCVRNVLVHVF